MLLHFNGLIFERECFENNDKELINMLWFKCMSKELIDFISQEYYSKLFYNLGFKYATAICNMQICNMQLQ